MGAAGETISVAAIADVSEEMGARKLFRLSIVEEAGNWSEIEALGIALPKTAVALASHPRCARANGSTASVVLADDQLLRSLNRTYRGKDSPTNVLSFPFKGLPIEERPKYLGDVVLAAETVTREALDQGIPFLHHTQHLVIHGVLHLLGFDHETEADAVVMERIETEVLAGLGIADPYSVS